MHLDAILAIQGVSVKATFSPPPDAPSSSHIRTAAAFTVGAMRIHSGIPEAASARSARSYHVSRSASGMSA